jgi:hypothetical protein
MTLAQHDQVLCKLTPKRSDKPFGIAILPRRPRRDAELPDTEMAHAAIKGSTEDFVAIANQEPERAVFAEGLYDLLRRPLGVRMGRDVYVQDPASLERQS